MIDRSTWRKSSHSADSASCVQVKGTLNALADTKNPEGPELTTSGLPQLITAIRTGRLTPIA